MTFTSYPYPGPRRFTVIIGRVRHSVGRNEGATFAGPNCDDCGAVFFDIERWSGWCVICQDCGRRYVALTARGA